MSVNTLIIGAGEACVELLNDLALHPESPCNVLAIIDDDPQKIDHEICGVPVVGNRNQILPCVEKYAVEHIIFAIPSLDPGQKREIFDICQQTTCKLRTLPSLYQFADPDANIRLVRDVALEDLLGREQSCLDLSQIFHHISGNTVLITGGGGSIGSELCRQLAGYNPKLLIILDIYENNVYELQQELAFTHPEVKTEMLIGSVRNKKRIESILAQYRPSIVYHAAAHKHVPLMEKSPHEAIKNNVLGTYNLAALAVQYNVKDFLLISTDKAVNPTNIMGASKRICEMIIQMFNRQSKTNFVAVRFGNVLGSNGSVVPLFQRQIASGGPVTVTHPEVVRFFMTVQEAVNLVLMAGASAKGGEIFVLDMGEPVKILDMAKKLIRLSGYTPDIDIKLVFNGLRPGEKLYEEILMNDEGLKHTANKKIFIASAIDFDEPSFMSQLKKLATLAYEESSDIKQYVSTIVNTYRPCPVDR